MAEAAEQLMEELLAAVQDCDLQEIEACLDAGASVSSPGLIHECVSTDDLQVRCVHVYRTRVSICHTVHTMDTQELTSVIPINFRL